MSTIVVYLQWSVEKIIFKIINRSIILIFLTDNFFWFDKSMNNLFLNEISVRHNTVRDAQNKIRGRKFEHFPRIEGTQAKSYAIFIGISDILFPKVSTEAETKN